MPVLIILDISPCAIKICSNYTQTISFFLSDNFKLEHYTVMLYMGYKGRVGYFTQKLPIPYQLLFFATFQLAPTVIIITIVIIYYFIRIHLPCRLLGDVKLHLGRSQHHRSWLFLQTTENYRLWKLIVLQLF